MTPGLLVLHGNPVDSLARAVMAWLAAHPLPGLQEEVILVPSIGMAEWFKMELAQAQGICAATRVELPARFLWRAYRAVLGAAAVPPVSALDKLPLTWRLMAGMPAWLAQRQDDPHWGPLRSAWSAADAVRRLQWAQRVADLFDQYQVYRSDWLDDWTEGRDRLAHPAGPRDAALPVPDDQRWQPELWRLLQAGLTPAEAAGHRARVHRRFLAALGAGAAGRAGEGAAAGPAKAAAVDPGAGTALSRLPTRLVLFGSTHLPQQTLEALVALSRHRPVLLAVPNPCRYHWADLIEGREWWAAARRRHPLRAGRDLVALPLEALHAHGHPLLAAWGRQARDFIRQLDAVDETAQRAESAGLTRVDLFEDGPGDTLLAQVQAQIRDLVPLAEHPGVPPPAEDRSIVFHVAHSAQREVEILHDQLLHLLAHPPGGEPLQPRDIVVMVPDVDRFVPAIRAVFGALPRSHPRHIPWSVVDLRERGQHPVLLALEWLLRIREQRVSSSELRDLLDVPAVAAALGLEAEAALAVLQRAEEAGARWGLDAAQREALGLPGCDGLNSWRFALQRLLLGFAAGPAGRGFGGLEPAPGVGGLEAADIGRLDGWLRRLQAWWAEAGEPGTPMAWAARARALLEAFFAAEDTATRTLLAALDDALSAWLDACEAAGFDEAVDVAVLREAWLSGFEQPGARARFKAGGVTFATLLPLRAIPFEVVCLLGMNEGDYPRPGGRDDMDLMARPGAARAGDRSRRHDDRQLMLDALLAARRVLYISWVGRSVRDNQPQPPSVLVAQLRDYLEAGWGRGTLAARTTEHPLQPFSRRYFEAPPPGSAPAPGLLTYAAEWRDALQGLPAGEITEGTAATAVSMTEAARFSGEGTPAAHLPLPSADDTTRRRWTLDNLTRLLIQPVSAFLRTRLAVDLDLGLERAPDEEPFDVGRGLARWALVDAVLADARQALAAPPASMSASTPDAADAAARAAIERQRRAGALPLGRPGRDAAETLRAVTEPMLRRWVEACAAWPAVGEPLSLAWPPGDAAPRLQDTLDGLRRTPGDGRGWIELRASRLLPANGKSQRPVPRALAGAWVRSLVLAATGQAAEGLVIAADTCAQLDPLPRETAVAQLDALLALAAEGLAGERPLATARDTAMAWLDDAARAAAVFDGSSHRGGEREDPALARWYPDFAALHADPHFADHTQRLYGPYRDWLAAHVHLSPLPDAAPPAEGAASADDGGDPDD